MRIVLIVLTLVSVKSLGCTFDQAMDILKNQKMSGKNVYMSQFPFDKKLDEDYQVFPFALTLEDLSIEFHELYLDKKTCKYVGHVWGKGIPTE